MQHGIVTEVWPDNSKYEGKYENEKNHGCILE